MLGRTDFMMTIRGTNVYPTAIDNLLATVDELSPNYELHISTDRGMDALTVYQTPSSKMAFPRVGMPVKLEAAEARLLDLGYVRVLIWQWRGITYALAGSLPAAALIVIADEMTSR